MAIKAPAIIKSNEIPNLILLYGPEDYLKRQFKNRFIDALLPDRDNMNFSRFSNISGRKEESDKFAPDIIAMAGTLPFFSEKRVILCENTGYFKNKNEDISDFIKDVPPFTHIIFAEKEVTKSTGAFKTISKIGFVEEYTMPERPDLIKWIGNKLKQDGMSMDRDALNAFMERCAVNMDNIDRELEKLISYCLKDKNITLNAVDEICTPTYEEQIFNIINAIANKDKEKALKEYATLHSLRVNPRSILALLNSRFTQIMNIKMAKDAGRDDRSIAAGLGIRNEYAYRKNLENANSFSFNSLKTILNTSAEYIQKMNTGLLGEETGVEMFILKSLRA